MLHVRLVVPADRAAAVLVVLDQDPAVAHLAHHPQASIRPAGDVITADVAREAADRVIEIVRGFDLHRDGAIVFASAGTTISDSALRAEQAAPGDPGDALVWEQLESRARGDATMTASYLAFMMLAAVIAAAGVLTDSPVLIVGAMVVGPDFGPVSALCVAIAKPRWLRIRRAAVTLVAGLLASTLAAAATTALLRGLGVVDRGYEVADRGLTAFISHPDAFAVVVAVAAGIAGMLSLAVARETILVGVVISVTTIPAAANLGVAAAVSNGEEAAGAAAQLGVNVAVMIAAGALTLVVMRVIWRRVAGRDGTPPM
jgi:uncharacterized hydrophobic protein (TIGR00271 family)